MSERYTLPEEVTPRLLLLGCAISWCGSTLAFMNIGSAITRWLTGYPSQGILGIFGTLLLGSGLVTVGLFTQKPSPFWHHRIIHRIIGALLILSQLLDLVQFSILLAFCRTGNEYWWARYAKNMSRAYKMQVSIVGIVFASLSLLASILYAILFSRVGHIHRHQGSILRIQRPPPEYPYTAANTVVS